MPGKPPKPSRRMLANFSRPALITITALNVDISTHENGAALRGGAFPILGSGLPSFVPRSAFLRAAHVVSIWQGAWPMSLRACLWGAVLVALVLVGCGPSGKSKVKGPGPWPVANALYGAGQGILE